MKICLDLNCVYTRVHCYLCVFSKIECALCLTQQVRVWTITSILTSSSLRDVEAGQECKHVASALDTTWLQTHGHKLLTVDEDKCQI